MRKEQRRAAERAVRQQREIARQQLRALRRRSILGPVILVGLGVAFLLVELGTVPAGMLLSLFTRWWPAVLVLAGLILLAEWAADTWIAGRNAATLPRRTLGPGTVLFLVVLTLVGAGLMRWQPGGGWLQGRWTDSLVSSWGLADMFAQRVETEQELSAPLRAGAVLSVQNYQGDVTVSGSSTDGLVHVTVHQRLVAWRREDLQTRKGRDAVKLVTSATGIVLAAPGEDRDETDLTIEVPHQTNVVIGKEAGQITVSELRGGVTVLEHHGSVELTGIAGPVRLASGDDDATLTGHSLDGSVLVEGRSGDLAFSDVHGPVTLHGDFFGTTHLERIEGPVQFQSSFTELRCAGLAGELRVEGRNELTARDVQGPLVLTTSDRTLTLTALHGGAAVTDRNGSITMELADLRAPVKAVTSAGSIDVRVPADAGFAVEASTTDGQIENDFGLRPETRDGGVRLQGQVGHGGATLSLHSTDGDVSFHSKLVKADEDRDTPDQDEDDPSTRGGQARRL